MQIALAIVSVCVISRSLSHGARPARQTKVVIRSHVLMGVCITWTGFRRPGLFRAGATNAARMHSSASRIAETAARVRVKQVWRFWPGLASLFPRFPSPIVRIRDGQDEEASKSHTQEPA